MSRCIGVTVESKPTFMTGHRLITK